MIMSAIVLGIFEPGIQALLDVHFGVNAPVGQTLIIVAGLGITVYVFIKHQVPILEQLQEGTAAHGQLKPTPREAWVMRQTAGSWRQIGWMLTTAAALTLLLIAHRM